MAIIVATVQTIIVCRMQYKVSLQIRGEIYVQTG